MKKWGIILLGLIVGYLLILALRDSIGKQYDSQIIGSLVGLVSYFAVTKHMKN